MAFESELYSLLNPFQILYTTSAEKQFYSKFRKKKQGSTQCILLLKSVSQLSKSKKKQLRQDELLFSVWRELNYSEKRFTLELVVCGVVQYVQ